MAGENQPRLSHDFIELYQSYKRKTKKAISWLQETCSLDDISITSLVTAAKTGQRQNTKVPPELYFVFKDALEMRIAVAQQYKKVRLHKNDSRGHESIKQHDFFISNITHSTEGKTVKPSTLVPYQTARLSPIGHLPSGRTPIALMQYMGARFQAADRVIEERTRCIRTMLQDMDTYLASFMRKTTKMSVAELGWLEIGAIDLQMRPLFEGLESFILCRGKDFTAEHNIWLSFLFESYNSFLWQGTSNATSANARLQLLRYIKEVASSINAVVDIARTEDDFKRIENLPMMASELERLAKIPRWDLYSQAPLVNGMAMLEINFQAMYMGINIWNDDGVAGFALHAYNLVLQKKILKQPIPILDRLCTLLEDSVFMGHRPTTNFRSALFRFMGGKMANMGKRRQDENGPPGGTLADVGRDFFIDAPKALPAAWEDNRRIKPEDLCKVYDLHSSKYAMGDALSKFPNFIFNKKKISDSARESDKDYDQEDWTEHSGRNILRSLNDVLRGEINMVNEDAFPLTRINGFAVWLLFRDILERIWNKVSPQVLTAAELAIHGPKIHPRVAGRSGAIIAVMLDSVDGAGNSAKSVKTVKSVKSRRGVRAANGGNIHPFMKKMNSEDATMLMDATAEAILEAVGSDNTIEKYLWRHL